ncbi:amidohydrolase family protein [Actinomycetota bacterium]
MNGRGLSVDTHAHLAVPAANALCAGHEGFAEELRLEQEAHSPESLALNRAQLERLGEQMTSVDRRIADMDAMGIDIQVVGPMPMHHYWADRELAQRLADVTNEGVAAHCAAYPDRLVGLGTASLQHPDLAAAQLRRAVEELGLRGISVSTNVDGKELSDPSLDEVWAVAEELQAVVFIHPWGCSLGSRLARSYLGNTVGQPVETTVALSNIIFTGVLDRFPRLKLLAAHGGGYLPTYIGRSDHAWGAREDARTCRDAPSAYLQRIWFDALVYTPQAAEMLVNAVGAGQVCIGTDYPFDMGLEDPLERLDVTLLDEGTKERIRSGNARRLLATSREPELPQ